MPMNKTPTTMLLMIPTPAAAPRMNWMPSLTNRIGRAQAMSDTPNLRAPTSATPAATNIPKMPIGANTMTASGHSVSMT